MRRVLVTGAAGFIGQHLMRELLEHDYARVGVDLVPGVGTLVGDLTAPGGVESCLTEFCPEVVVHLAAQVGRVFGEDDVRHTVRANAEMTTVLAKACGERGIPMVYASTSEVYGDHGDDLVDEDTPWKLPHNLYGLSKGWGEQVCRLYNPDGLTIVRLSMPYGPGAPPGRGRRAMDTMLWQAVHRMPITVHKGAERSWCWVGDTVRGIRLAMEHPGVYNVGRDDDPVSMFEIAQMACDYAGAPHSLIEEVEAPPNQTVVKRLSTARLRALGWEPTLSLRDGMPQVLGWVSRFDAEGNR